MIDIIARTSKALRVSRNSAELIIAALLGKPRYELYLDTTREDCNHGLLYARLAQLQKDIPLEYLTKTVQFRNFELSIEPGVFIPRIETEYLIDVITREVCRPPRSVLDIGTGSGALAIALAVLFPTARVVATDISPAALRCARRNIHTHHLESRIDLVCCSLFESLRDTYDLIVSNPPYIPSERLAALPRSVRDYEPLLALDGGPQGIRIIEKILLQARQYTDKNSIIALEIDDTEVTDIRRILKGDNDLSYSLHNDLFGKTRYILVAGA
jgi:release factor glutamine methyltransferase